MGVRASGFAVLMCRALQTEPSKKEHADVWAIAANYAALGYGDSIQLRRFDACWRKNWCC